MASSCSPPPPPLAAFQPAACGTVLSFGPNSVVRPLYRVLASYLIASAWHRPALTLAACLDTAAIACGGAKQQGHNLIRMRLLLFVDTLHQPWHGEHTTHQTHSTRRHGSSLYLGCRSASLRLGLTRVGGTVQHSCISFLTILKPTSHIFLLCWSCFSCSRSNCPSEWLDRAF